MKYAVIMACLLGSSCSSSPEQRVDYELVNESGQALRFEAGLPGFSKSVDIGPGGSWSGWLDARLVAGRTVRIVVKKAPSRDND